MCGEEKIEWNETYLSGIIFDWSEIIWTPESSTSKDDCVCSQVIIKIVIVMRIAYIFFDVNKCDGHLRCAQMKMCMQFWHPDTSTSSDAHLFSFLEQKQNYIISYHGGRCNFIHVTHCGTVLKIHYKPTSVFYFHIFVIAFEWATHHCDWCFCCCGWWWWWCCGCC